MSSSNNLLLGNNWGKVLTMSWRIFYFKFSFPSRRFLTPAKMLFLWTGRRPSFPAWSTWWISTRWTRDPCQPSCRTPSWTPGWWRRQVEIRGQPVLPVSVPTRHIAAGNWSIAFRLDIRILQQRTLSESSSLAWTTWTSHQLSDIMQGTLLIQSVEHSLYLVIFSSGIEFIQEPNLGVQIDMIGLSFITIFNVFLWRTLLFLIFSVCYKCVLSPLVRVNITWTLYFVFFHIQLER